MINFAELKLKLTEFDSATTRDYAEGLDYIQEQGATYTFIDGAKYQYTKDAKIISQLLEIIENQYTKNKSAKYYMSQWRPTDGEIEIEKSLSETDSKLKQLIKGV